MAKQPYNTTMSWQQLIAAVNADMTALYASAGGSLEVTDGTTTVNGATELLFSGATVSNPSGTIAKASISASGTSYRATWVNGGLPLNASGALQVPIPVGAASTLKEVTILTLGGPGNCTVDIWKTPIGSYPPTSSNDITGGTPPAISAGKTYDNTTLSGWTTAFSAGDTLLLTLAASSSFTLVSVTLRTG